MRIGYSMIFKVITTISVTAAVLAAPTPHPRGKSNGMAIPLTKHSSLLNDDKSIDIDAIKSHVASHGVNIIRWMKSFQRNTGTLHPSAVKQDVSPQNGAVVDLTIHGNDLWSAIISIGTPAKSFTVQFDTGSSDLFVPASTGDENCRSHPNLWDPASTSTAEALDQDFHIKFADGAIVDGKQYTDNVTIAGFTTIGAATRYSSNMAAPEIASDGILGLAFPSRSKYPASPLFHTLFSEGKLPQPVFSLELTASGGELYIGGTNEALYIDGSLAFTPVTNPDYWQLTTENMKVSDQIVLIGVPAIIDTGSNFIFCKSSQVLALHQAHGGKAFRDGYYTFPCSSFPSVTFTIGGKPFLIPANILNQGRVASDSPDCWSGIMTLETDDDAWTIGTIFLQQFYTVFDFSSQSPRVGFGKLVRTPEI